MLRRGWSRHLFLPQREIIASDQLASESLRSPSHGPKGCGQLATMVRRDPDSDPWERALGPRLTLTASDRIWCAREVEASLTPSPTPAVRPPRTGPEGQRSGPGSRCGGKGDCWACPPVLGPLAPSEVQKRVAKCLTRGPPTPGQHQRSTEIPDPVPTGEGRAQLASRTRRTG